MDQQPSVALDPYKLKCLVLNFREKKREKRRRMAIKVVVCIKTDCGLHAIICFQFKPVNSTQIFEFC